MDDLKTALAWRTRNGYIGRNGVIIVFDGLAQGWVNELRNPETWRPGCIAVDESGNSWIAIGGNDQDGASTWMPRDTSLYGNRTSHVDSSAGGMS